MKKKDLSILDEWEIEEEIPLFKLKLYITGTSPNSARAISNLKNICENYIKTKYELEIIDVYQQPAKAKSEELIALPMMMKYFPLPAKKFFGDMSNTEKVLAGLGLNK